MPMETKQADIIMAAFLGSGKSTLLQDLIAYEKDRGRKLAC
ncbi:hypothetical protein KHA80_20520 [Anaerobacillus sp. HL2]|nr:hypothetical protein KHA80_20520 [Anaerobacillus sp. HL2]